MSPRFLLVPVLLTGCGLNWTAQGTAVGNPTDMSVHAAPAGAGLDFRQANAGVATLNLAAASGQTSAATIAATVDLLGGTSLPVASGSWSSFTLRFSSPLTFEVSQDGLPGASFALVVDQVSVAAAADIPTDVGPFVLELGGPGWLSAKELAEIAAGGSDQALAEATLVARLKSGSSLFLDADGDGAVDEADRGGGALMGQDDDDADGTHDTGGDDTGGDDTGAD